MKMKRNLIQKRGNLAGKTCLFSAFVMAAAALTGCSAEDTDRQTVDGRPVPVEVVARVGGTGNEVAMTRTTTTTLNSSSFSLSTTSNSSSKLNIRIDNGSGTYTNNEFSVNGTTITAVSTLPAFPGGVSTVHVYGWYPQNSNSLAFTVQADQSTDANYCLSDVMVATNANCTRELSGSTWTVTPASLTFKHIFSKLALTVTPAANVTITGVSVTAMKSSTLSETKSSNAVTAFTAGTASTSGTITLYSNSTGTTSSQTYCCVIPPQTVQTTNTTFITVKAKVGSTEGTINYKVSANKTFASDNIYSTTLNVTADLVQVNGTVTVSNWTTTNGTVGTLTPDRGGV